MASVSPQLPPGVSEKRKREEDDDSSSDDSTGPAPPPRKRSKSPAPEPKKARTIGPTLPPAPLDERPTDASSLTRSEESEQDDDDNDDFGPSLPPSNSSKPYHHTTDKPTPPLHEPAPTQATRDSWMLVPPSSSDWTARVDPSKLRARKFNTGKGSSSQPAPSPSESLWHETLPEKQARLQREMMGISSPSTNPPPKPKRQEEATLKKIQKSRGASLYASHQANEEREQEDDPSARAFDRDKDIGGGMQINSTKRREMLVKSKEGIGSRFASARYL